MLCWKNQLNAVSWRSVSTCTVNHYNWLCSCSTSKPKANVTFQPQSEGLWEQDGAGGGIFHCNTFFLSSAGVIIVPNQEELLAPHRVQSRFSIAALRYSKGDLHLSSLRLVILIITRHFSFWVKVTPFCWVQQTCWGVSGSLCFKPVAVGYLGYWIAHTPWCWMETVAEGPCGCSRSKQCCAQ